MERLYRNSIPWKRDVLCKKQYFCSHSALSHGDVSRRFGMLLIGTAFGTLLFINTAVTTVNGTSLEHAGSNSSLFTLAMALLKLMSRRTVHFMVNSSSHCQMMFYIYIAVVYRRQLQSYKLSCSQIGKSIWVLQKVIKALKNYLKISIFIIFIVYI